MFGVGAGEFLVLLILGVLLFGPEKIPDIARKVARVVHYLRGIANNAQSTIRSELGPGYEDFDIRDPKAFIRRHLMDEMDPLLADVRKELDESKHLMREATDELRKQRPAAGGVMAVTAASMGNNDTRRQAEVQPTGAVNEMASPPNFDDEAT